MELSPRSLTRMQRTDQVCLQKNVALKDVIVIKPISSVSLVVDIFVELII